MRSGMLEAPMPANLGNLMEDDGEDYQDHQRASQMVNEAGVDFGADNYYADLLRRVYLHRDIEGWSSKQTMDMLKDSQKFEKYYLNVSVQLN